MGDFKEEALAVEKILGSSKNAFTPLELLIINKRYIEGLNWEDLMEQLHTSPEYARFRYERSTYMRAHKSALEKIIAMEEKE